MKIIELVCGPLENNAFMLVEGSEAYLIDAPFGSLETATKELKKYNAQLKGVIMTHGHWDHLGDLSEFQKQGLVVYAHQASRDFIENPAIQSSYSIPGISLKASKIDTELEEGSALEVLGATIEILHIPGHSNGSVVLYIPSQKVAFVGDVVFRNSIGRTDLPGGNHQLLLQGIQQKLYKLPDDTLLYPGHGPSTSVGYEKKHNPFVKG